MIDLDLAKAHVGVDFDTHDALIAAMLSDAIDAVERESGHIIKRRTIKQYFDGGFPASIKLYRTPVISITAVRYVGSDGVAATVDVDPGNGELRLIEGEPYIILPPASSAWPSTETGTRVEVEYIAGYHDTALEDDDAAQLDVPGSLDAAVRLTVGHFYMNREDVVTGTTATSLPKGASDLIRPFRRMML